MSVCVTVCCVKRSNSMCDLNCVCSFRMWFLCIFVCLYNSRVVQECLVSVSYTHLEDNYFIMLNGMQNTIKGLTDRQNNKSKLKKLLIFKFVYKNVKIITSKKYK